MLFRPSSIVLVVANLVPLAGVFFLKWQVLDILMLYWAENVVIGLINVLRMALAGPGGKFFLIPFFIVHYGMFCYGHLAAVTGIFSDAMGAATARDYFFGMPADIAWRSPLWLAIAAIAVSHLFSFFANFVAGGEYHRTSTTELMRRPYGRIFVLHVAVIIGAALIQWLGSPVMMLFVLVAAKIALDLRLHLSEREKFSTETTTL